MKRTVLNLSLSITLACASVCASAQGLLAGRFLARATEQRAELIEQLNLDPTQQSVLATVDAARRQFMLQLMLDLPPLMARVKADLANPNADLRATAAAVQSTVDREIAAHRQVVAAKLDLYDALSPTQQAQVRAELSTRLEAVDKLREALMALAAAR